MAYEYDKEPKWYISKKNEDVGRILNGIKIKYPNNRLSDILCQLIRDGYNYQEKCSVPRMNEFYRRKIRYETLTEALYNGRINEQEVSDMYLSCKAFLAELEHSEMLQRIVDRQLNGLTPQNGGRIDKWFKE